MRTITKTYEVYPLAELTTKAQQEAYYQWLNDFDYDWNNENQETLEAFCSLFNVACTRWEYDAHLSFPLFYQPYEKH